MLEQGWGDLESFVKLVGDQNVFVASERPTTLKDCSSRVRLAMGAKASDFAANKRTTNAKPNRQPRGFKVDIPVLRAVMENYTTKRDPTGQSRIGLFSSNIMDAMATVCSTHFGWAGTLQEIKAQLESMTFEAFLTLFRIHLQRELGYCFLITKSWLHLAPKSFKSWVPNSKCI